MLASLQLHHIGYAVRDILTTAGYYTGAGWVMSEIYCDKIQNAQIAILSKAAFPLIELVAPVDEKSPVVNMLKHNKMAGGGGSIIPCML